MSPHQELLLCKKNTDKSIIYDVFITICPSEHVLLFSSFGEVLAITFLQTALEKYPNMLLL